MEMGLECKADNRAKIFERRWNKRWQQAWKILSSSLAK